MHPLAPTSSSARLVFCLHLPLHVCSAFSPETVLLGKGRWGKYQAQSHLRRLGPHLKADWDA